MRLHVVSDIGLSCCITSFRGDRHWITLVRSAWCGESVRTVSCTFKEVKKQRLVRTGGPCLDHYNIGIFLRVLRWGGETLDAVIVNMDSVDGRVEHTMM